MDLTAKEEPGTTLGPIIQVVLNFSIVRLETLLIDVGRPTYLKLRCDDTRNESSVSMDVTDCIESVQKHVLNVLGC